MKNLKYIIISLFVLGAFVSAQAYDFSSRTKYSVEEALDSVWLYYSINPDGTTVSVTQGPEKYKFNHVRIPETVSYNNNTYIVTEIAYKAFSDGNIDIVEMPNTVTIIDDYAFYQCGLDSIKFSTSLKSMGNYACAQNDLTSVYLPEGLETIGNYVFKGRHSSVLPLGKIHTISLPSTLKNIGEGAFSSNRYLNNVVIPEGITEIRYGTFSSCLELSNVKLPNGLIKIGEYAFRFCGFTELDADFFPKSLIEIGDFAFSNYANPGSGIQEFTRLKKVVLPNNILSIGRYCFSNNYNLESITFSSGMAELPKDVCSNCNRLVDVKIPNSITKIGDDAFAYTGLLSHVELPTTITEIGSGAFRKSGLVSISIPPLVEEIKGSTFSSCEYLVDVKILGLLKTIGGFDGCSRLTNVKIPSTVKTILSGAFAGCTSLNNIELPDSLLDIEARAFCNCKAIKNINLPKLVKTIGEDCFNGCDSLKIINIYHNISTITEGVFYGCSNLKEVHLKKAIVPNFRNTSASGYKYIEDGNNCTLYVPTGCKATYESSKHWKNFDTIEEEEIGYDILYRVTASKTGQGTILINDESKTSIDILSGTKVNVAFTPASGWKLKSVVLNDKDVTTSLVENVYEVESLDANMVFVATFEELPAILSLRSADGGSIDVSVVKGATFSCVFTPDKDWEINNVRYNNTDVTSSVSECGEYTTPVIKNDAILSVSYEKGANSVNEISLDANMKAYVSVNGLLVVEGVDHGMPVVLYDVDGKILSSLVAVDGRCSYQLPDVGVYVVKGISKTIKVVY